MKEYHKPDILKTIELFSTLSDEEIDHVRERAMFKKFRKNETILHEEDTNEYIYMILSGGVKVLQTTQDGKEIVLAMHRSRDFFGEMSLLDGKTVPASVVATEDSLVAIMSRKDFYSVLFSQRALLETVLRILCGRLRESWEKVRLLTYKDAALRIKALFFLLSGEYGEEGDGGLTLRIKLTHKSIADMTGLARETVTRMLDKWQKDGEITILRHKFIRLNRDFLKKDLDYRIHQFPRLQRNNGLIFLE
jgi:CRP/FNR family transcriptional regulator, cyclic AMP receptor protein